MKNQNRNNIFLSVIIPAYNEEKNIRLGSLDKAFRYLEHQEYTYEVIVVNDGSTDETSNLLEKMKKSFRNLDIIHNKHAGKAVTVVTGMKHAKGSVILFCDLDQATPIGEIENLLPWFEKGFDVVIGSRNNRRQGAPVLRLIMARGFMMLREVILGLKGIRDTQCGFKAFRRNAVEKIVPRLRLYDDTKDVSGSMVTAGFDVELLYITHMLGFRIKEVTVDWHYVETRRVNPLKDSIQGLTDILRIKLNALRGQYKI